jgi:hypothetical protein
MNYKNILNNRINYLPILFQIKKQILKGVLQYYGFFPFNLSKLRAYNAANALFCVIRSSSRRCHLILLAREFN